MWDEHAILPLFMLQRYPPVRANHIWHTLLTGSRASPGPERKKPPSALRQLWRAGLAHASVCWAWSALAAQHILSLAFKAAQEGAEPCQRQLAERGPGDRWSTASAGTISCARAQLHPCKQLAASGCHLLQAEVITCTARRSPAHNVPSCILQAPVGENQIQEQLTHVTASEPTQNATGDEHLKRLQ